LPAQIDTAYENGDLDIITLTIGANDTRWRQFIQECYTVRCGTTFDNATTKVLRGDLRLELYRALYEIQQHDTDGEIKVILTGYFKPYSAEDCDDTQGISADEKTWANDQATKINQAIYSVTKWFSFSEYVPVDFSGHELCSSDPWVQGRNDPYPFHPTIEGQQAIATTLTSSLSQ